MEEKWKENADNGEGRNVYAPVVNASRSFAKYRNIAKLKYWSNPVARGRMGMTVEKQRADNVTNDSTSDCAIVQ